MKERLKIFGLMVAALISGVMLGTAVSGPLFDMPLGDWAYLGALILAPFEMTFGIPIVFDHSQSVGTLVVSGLFITIGCFIWGMIKCSLWAVYGLFLGSLLWSLGNVLALWAFMSV